MYVCIILDFAACYIEGYYDELISVEYLMTSKSFGLFSISEKRIGLVSAQ